MSETTSGDEAGSNRPGWRVARGVRRGVGGRPVQPDDRVGSSDGTSAPNGSSATAPRTSSATDDRAVPGPRPTGRRDAARSPARRRPHRPHGDRDRTSRRHARADLALPSRPVCDAAGVLIGFVGVARDLTEQRLAQAALAEIECSPAGRGGPRPRRAGGSGTSPVEPSSGARRCTASTASIRPASTAPWRPTSPASTPTIANGLRAALAAAVDRGRPFDVEYRIRRRRRCPSDGCTPVPSRRSARSGRSSGSRGFAQGRHRGARRRRGRDSPPGDRCQRSPMILRTRSTTSTPSTDVAVARIGASSTARRSTRSAKPWRA